MRRKAVSDMADRQARKASWHGKAFLVEALVLLVFLVASLSILVSLFVQARTEADEGERLSQAVQLAQNAAEEFAADPAGAQGLALQNDGLVATVQVGEEPHESGSLLNATVTVVDEEGGGSIAAGEEIYRLDTARYVPGFEGGLQGADADGSATGVDSDADGSGAAAGTGATADSDADAGTGADASASSEAEGGVE